MEIGSGTDLSFYSIRNVSEYRYNLILILASNGIGDPHIKERLGEGIFG